MEAWESGYKIRDASSCRSEVRPLQTRVTNLLTPRAVWYLSHQSDAGGALTWAAEVELATTICSTSIGHSAAPGWTCSSYAICQQNPQLFTEIHHQTKPSQFNPFHIFRVYLWNNHFNISLITRNRSSKRYFPLRFLSQNFVSISFSIEMEPVLPNTLFFAYQHCVKSTSCEGGCR
jgi:hypothetical protein